MDVNHSSVRAPQYFRAVLARDILFLSPRLVDANDLELDAVGLPLLVEIFQIARLLLLLFDGLPVGHDDVLAGSTNRNTVLITVLTPRSIAHDAVFGFL